jgi:hypothetical protein
MPVHLDPEIDFITTHKKAESIGQCIQHLEYLMSNNKNREAYEYSRKIKNKISRMRKAGLNREGIYSPENLAFKMLRNAGFLEKLASMKLKSYDRVMSLNLE